MGRLAALCGRSLIDCIGRAARPRAGLGRGWGSNGRLCMALRAMSPAMLGRPARGETRSAHFVRYARTVAASQFTRRAARATGRPALLGSRPIRPSPCPARPSALPDARRCSVLREPPRLLQGCGRACAAANIETPEKHSACGRAPNGAPRGLTHRDCLSGTNEVSAASFAVDRRREHRRGRGAQRHAMARF